jgi:hypothetical protein
LTHQVKSENIGSASGRESVNKRSHFASGVLTPDLTKGDARPLGKLHLMVPR